MRVSSLDGQAPELAAPTGLRQLTPDALEDDTRVRVLRAVRFAGEGVSTSDVARAVEVSSPTVLRVLKDLEREREVYSRSVSKRRILLWYPNGRLVHPYLELFREIRGKTYRASIQEGKAGPALQLQERTYSLLHGERIEGAIFFDYVALDQMIELLNDLRERYDTSGATPGQGK